METSKEQGKAGLDSICIFAHSNTEHLDSVWLLRHTK